MPRPQDGARAGEEGPTESRVQWHGHNLPVVYTVVSTLLVPLTAISAAEGRINHCGVCFISCHLGPILSPHGNKYCSGEQGVAGTGPPGVLSCTSKALITIPQTPPTAFLEETPCSSNPLGSGAGDTATAPLPHRACVLSL
jgi:hypothetical protein